MDRGWYLRLVIIIGVFAAAAYLLYPSYYAFFVAPQEQRDDHAKLCAALPSWIGCKKFNLPRPAGRCPPGHGRPGQQSGRAAG
jgi:preprotein translocase subunit SecD